jgi:hypothetical protein
MNKVVSLLLPCAAIFALGCSQAELYRTGQGWQQQECRKLKDPAERSRCEKSSAMSYEQYRAEVDAARSAGGTRSP